MMKKITSACITFVVITILSSCASYHRTWRPVNIKDVYVDIGTPRHWTLEDAHYLLADLQERMNTITIQSPSTLNPNETNSIQLQSVQTVTDLALQYDELTAIKNKNNLSTFDQNKNVLSDLQSRVTKDSENAEELRSKMFNKKLEKNQKDYEVAAKKLELDSANSKLQILKDKLQDLNEENANQEEKSNQDTLIEEQKAKVDKIEQQYQSLALESLELQQDYDVMNSEYEYLTNRINTDTSTLSNNQLSLSATTASPKENQSPILTEMFSSAISTALNDDKSNSSPKLHTSEVLSNYINAENELLARQLTMIKGDIGEENTLVFLEFPHAIDSVEGNSSQRKVQILWQVEEVCVYDPTAALEEAIKILKSIKEKEANTDNQESFGFKSNQNELIKKSLAFGSDEKILNHVISEIANTEDKDLIISDIANIKDDDLIKKARTLYKIHNDQILSEKEKDNIEQYIAALRIQKRKLLKSRDEYVKKACNKDEKPDDVIAWDLIPKADKFNITSQSYDSSSFNLSGLFSLITGIGGEASYQKRKEFFQQIASQQSLSSAFGQGNSKFGWIFNPRLGTNIVSQGANTTYASLIAPVDSKVLKLKSYYCVLSSGEHIGNVDDEKCSIENSKLHTIIVDSQPDFWVNDIDYGLVGSGETATIIIQGEDFYRNQLSILVDGNPLNKHSTSNAKSNNNYGSFEVLNSKEIVLKIKMPVGYEGTPEITLVTPQKSKTINYLNVRLGILGNKVSSLMLHDKMPIFQKSPQISSLKAYRRDKTNVLLKIEGNGFYENSTFIVNGQPYFPNVGKDRTKTEKSFNLVSTKNVDLVVPFNKEYNVYVSNDLAGKQLNTYSSVKGFEPDPDTMIVTAVETILFEAQQDRNLLYMIARGNKLDSLTIEDLTQKSSIQNKRELNDNAVYFEVITTENSFPLSISKNGQSFLKTIVVPKMPQIYSVKNEDGKSSGLTTGGYTIVITGQNFENVDSVSIDSKKVTIIAKSDSKIQFTAPQNLSAGKKRIVLTTSATIQGKKITNSNDLDNDNATFEFIAPKDSKA